MTYLRLETDNERYFTYLFLCQMIAHSFKYSNALERIGLPKQIYRCVTDIYRQRKPSGQYRELRMRNRDDSLTLVIERRYEYMFLFIRQDENIHGICLAALPRVVKILVNFDF